MKRMMFGLATILIVGAPAMSQAATQSCAIQVRKTTGDFIAAFISCNNQAPTQVGAARDLSLYAQVLSAASKTKTDQQFKVHSCTDDGRTTCILSK